MRPLSGKELARMLEERGGSWRIAGTHHIYRKEGRAERISVPVHGNTPLKRGLQLHLMKVAGISPDEI
jgi:predicted RNA binding protein YcfA (HicA-like mRNA interferase family)